MSEYGSVRQYRYRLTRMFRAGDFAPQAVSCPECLKSVAACEECSLLGDEWDERIMALMPRICRAPTRHVESLLELVR